NAFVEIDCYSVYKRQEWLLTLILSYDKLCRAALLRGAKPMALFEIPQREQIGRAKSVPDDQFEAVYAKIAKDMEQEIAAVAEKGALDA
ncbi:MAG: V-type ATP synthase subunit A, partial [Pseudoflavonifractor sp.]